MANCLDSFTSRLGHKVITMAICGLFWTFQACIPLPSARETWDQLDVEVFDAATGMAPAGKGVIKVVFSSGYANWQGLAASRALTIEEAFWRSEQERRLYELREKALRDELSRMEGARAEGRVEGKAEGKVEMAREAICQYLEARFGKASRDLQKKVTEYNNLEVLTKIMNKVYTASLLEDARTIIEA